MKINELKIYTSNLTKQIDFYTQTLELKIIRQSASSVSFQIGNSTFTLTESEDFLPYHFAINIPSNQEEEALEWLKSRVDILKDGDIEIQDFNFWNAKAIYFYDADKNIVEFIARKTLSNESNKGFTTASLLEISEIGVPVNDIETAFNDLQTIVPIKQYDGGIERFCAIGDETGLFICINKNIKNWFPTDDKANSSEFGLLFEENGEIYQLEFKSGRILQLTD